MKQKTEPTTLRAAFDSVQNDPKLQECNLTLSETPNSKLRVTYRYGTVTTIYNNSAILGFFYKQLHPNLRVSRDELTDHELSEFIFLDRINFYMMKGKSAQSGATMYVYHGTDFLFDLELAKTNMHGRDGYIVSNTGLHYVQNNNAKVVFASGKDSHAMYGLRLGGGASATGLQKDRLDYIASITGHAHFNQEYSKKFCEKAKEMNTKQERDEFLEHAKCVGQVFHSINYISDRIEIYDEALSSASIKLKKNMIEVARDDIDADVISIIVDRTKLNASDSEYDAAKIKWDRFIRALDYPQHTNSNKATESSKEFRRLTPIAQMHNLPADLAEKCEAGRNDFRKKYAALYKEQSKGFFGCFRSSNLEDYDFLTIIEHAQKSNNRSRRICMQLGWMDAKGQLTKNSVAERVMSTLQEETNTMITQTHKLSANLAKECRNAQDACAKEYSKLYKAASDKEREKNPLFYPHESKLKQCDFQTIIERAQKSDDLIRKACVNSGWMDAQGQLIKDSVAEKFMSAVQGKIEEQGKITAFSGAKFSLCNAK